jgi:hypothetical protein
MNDPNLIIRIPQPCSEDWNAMTPDQTGKFCGSCCKSVIDFSNKTDTEIKDILMASQGQKICGHFKKTQVDRPLNLKINLQELPHNMSVARAFAVALLMVFGTVLFSCTTHKDQKLDKVEVVGMVEPQPNTTEQVIPETFTLGQTVQEVLETKTGEVAIQHSEETICNMIKGDVVYEPIEDTLKKEEPVMEELIMGKMIYGPVTETLNAVPETKDSLMLEKHSGINDLNTSANENSFIIYPNPSKGELKIKYELSKKMDVTVHVFDMNGSLVKIPVDIKGQHAGRYEVEVSLAELANGVYIVNLVKDKELSTQKVVIEK